MQMPCHNPPRARKGEPYTLDQCRLCWNYLNDPVFIAADARDPGEKPLPSKWKQGVNLGVALVKRIISGLANCTDEEKAERISVCKGGCEEYRESDGHCAKCGCPVEEKAGWATEDCPLKKWPALARVKEMPTVSSCG